MVRNTKASMMPVSSKTTVKISYYIDCVAWTFRSPETWFEICCKQNKEQRISFFSNIDSSPKLFQISLQSNPRPNHLVSSSWGKKHTFHRKGCSGNPLKTG